MLSRDNFQFVLQPWEHRGVQFDPRPHAVTSIEFAGTNRTVLLKAGADRLFFRFADRKGGSRREAVFAITTPFYGTCEDAPAFFHEAVASKQVARYVLDKYWLEFSDEAREFTTLLWLFNENASRMTGWIREWCGGDWMAWDTSVFSSSIEQYSIWDERWYPSFDAKVFERICPIINRRHFPPEQRQSTPAHWVRGSGDELSRVLNAYFTLFTRDTGFYNEILTTEPWHNTHLKYWAWNTNTSGVDLPTDIQGELVSSYKYRCELINCMAPRWADLVTEHNFAVGLTWHYSGEGDAECRANWRCENPVFNIDVPVLLAYPPSQHERMEALLFLRQWLHGKVPDSKIEEWLSPQP